MEPQFLNLEQQAQSDVHRIVVADGAAAWRGNLAHVLPSPYRRKIEPADKDFESRLPRLWANEYEPERADLWNVLGSSNRRDIVPTPFICTACGQQYAASDQPPSGCAICQDGRQYVPVAGQQWTTPKQLQARHLSAWRRYEPRLMGLGMQPHFAIGQRCLLVDTDDGLVMWDCIPMVDDASAALIRALGGLRAVAISHPHYYAAMVDWSRAFEDVPVWLHADDKQWVMRPDACIRHWGGERQEIAPGLMMIRTGGHFAGASVLHWKAGAGGAGALLTGDTVQVGPDRQVSFMRSYPNLVPLDRAGVQRIADALRPLSYDRVYGAFFDRVVPADGKRVVQDSVDRYLAALAGRF